MKEGSGLNKLFMHIKNYSLGSILVTGAGFISFPIFTRLLSTDEYGLLSLVAVTLTFLVAVGKLGLQNPIVRFYSDAESGKDGIDLKKFYATVVYGMLGIGTIATLIWLFIVYVSPDSWWNDPRLKALFTITAILVIIRIMESAFANIFRARQLSKKLVTYRVIRKYSILTGVVITLYFISRDLIGLYSATIVVELAAVITLSVLVLKNVKLSIKEFSPALLKKMLIFGIPLVGYELAWTLLNIGDRYLIQVYLGASQLGVYAAAYSLCDYVRIIVIMSLYQALPPIYIRMWNEKGEAATRAFVEKSLFFYILVGFPVIAGLSVVGPGLLTLLASEKYSSGAVIIPYVITGMVINGSVAFFSAGLYIHKKGKILMLITMVTAAVNVALNVVLIPEYGITGAAIATLISYVLLATANKMVSSKILNIEIPWIPIFKFGFSAFLMYAAITQIVTSSPLLTLLLQMVLGGIIYAISVFAIDAQIRNITKDYFYKIRNR